MADLKMPAVNYIMIAGNLTKDPVYRTIGNGSSLVNFTLASNRRYRDGHNQWQEDACFIGVVAWNRLADSCRDRLGKGSAVLIDGELQSRSWKSENGGSRNLVEIKARRIQFLSKRFKDGGPEEDTITEFYDDEEHFEEDPLDKLFLQDENNQIKKDPDISLPPDNENKLNINH
ncbi:MAG: single-stranded DNA-binding protein [Ignavibacteriales bacterium]|nr:single-stranded DNA-binding protein [Ignavibacteriales bacterium]